MTRTDDIKPFAITDTESIEIVGWAHTPEDALRFVAERNRSLRDDGIEGREHIIEHGDDLIATITADVPASELRDGDVFTVESCDTPFTVTRAIGLVPLRDDDPTPRHSFALTFPMFGDGPVASGIQHIRSDARVTRIR
jgi:hypothetical protein